MTRAKRRRVTVTVAAMVAAIVAVGAALVPGTAVGAPPESGGRAPILRDSSPAQAGLVAGPIEQMVGDLSASLAPSPTRPLYAGGVVLAGYDGRIVQRTAAGFALRYADGGGTELPRDQWIPAQADTIYDLASVSKLFTSIVVVQQVEAGLLDLDHTVASYIPEFAVNGKQSVTLRQLLTHTSGFPAWLPLYSAYKTPEERIGAVYAATLTNPPGTKYLYSDLNMITAGKLVELVTGQTLDHVVRERITKPLGMIDTGYNPPAALRDRIAATEWQPSTGRGMVHGTVHDENAWSLGGVAGHAGVFSTADDLAVLAQTIVNGGAYGHARILSPESVDALVHNENSAFPGNAHGLGFELNQRWYMDALSSPQTVGHTGYTGTSLVIDLASRSFVILLTNRVHPSRDWGSNNPARRAVARDLALAIPVKASKGNEAWFSGVGDARTATLTVPLTLGDRSKLDFDLWYDTESTDVVTLESSADGGVTWRELDRWSGWSGKQWNTQSVDLAKLSGAVQLRWRYTTDSLYQGRGVYVDGLRVTDGHQVLFDDSRSRDVETVRLQGWALSAS